MKNLIFLSMFSLFLLIALPSIVSAHSENSGSGSSGSDEERVEIRFDNDIDEDEEIADATATFEIRGTVTAMTEDTLTVAGETITVDPTMVPEFEQKGTPEVDDMVKVEGVIVDGTMLAEELEVI